MSDERIYRRAAFLALTVAIFSLLAACPKKPTPPAPTAKPTTPQPSLFGPISHGNLKYLGVSNACAASSACVDVADTISIWKATSGNSGRPKKVRWWVDNSQKKDYYWEIEYKGMVADENWLGKADPYTIKCNSNKVTSKKPNPADLAAGDLTWPYQVTVYKCTDDKKQGACLCKTDPRIAIHD